MSASVHNAATSAKLRSIDVLRRLQLCMPVSGGDVVSDFSPSEKVDD